MREQKSLQYRAVRHCTESFLIVLNAESEQQTFFFLFNFLNENMQYYKLKINYKQHNSYSHKEMQHKMEVESPGRYLSLRAESKEIHLNSLLSTSAHKEAVMKSKAQSIDLLHQQEKGEMKNAGESDVKYFYHILDD